MQEITWRQALKQIDNELIERAIKLPNSKKRTRKDKLFFIVNGNQFPAKRIARLAWNLKDSDIAVNWNGAGGTKELEQFFTNMGYGIVREEAENTKNTKQTLLEKACMAITNYVDKYGISNEVLSCKEVISIATAVYPEIKSNGSNMQPSDICYNRCNGNTMTKNFESWPHALVYLGADKYRLLGSDYPYTGEVFWKKSGESDEFIFGEWFEGEFKEYDSCNQIKLSDKEAKEKDFIKKTDECSDQFAKEGFDRESVVKIRINQSDFRRRLLQRYEGCCLCGLGDKNLLVASHIKPWAASDGKEKTDINNGLLLCPNHDKLFDQGYISFDENGGIIISDMIAEEDRMRLNIHSDDEIKICEANKKYLLYHRNNIFK